MLIFPVISRIFGKFLFPKEILKKCRLSWDSCSLKNENWFVSYCYCVVSGHWLYVESFTFGDTDIAKIKLGWSIKFFNR